MKTPLVWLKSQGEQMNERVCLSVCTSEKKGNVYAVYAFTLSLIPNSSRLLAVASIAV
jgi:hypothetical protein